MTIEQPSSGDMQTVNLTTGDVDELTRVGSSVFSPHRLVYRGGEALLSASEVSRLSIVTMRYRGGATVATTEALGYYAVHLPRAGRNTVRFARDEIEVSAGMGVVFNPEDRPTMRWSADLHQVGIKVPVAVMLRHRSAVVAEPVERPMRFAHRSRMRGTSGWEAVTGMLADLEHRGDGKRAVPGLALHVEDMLLTALLLSQPNSWSERLFGERRVAGRSAMTEAREFIEADPAADWTVTALAASVGVSVRSLQDGFRRTFGTTPTQYLKLARLALAHRLLLDEGSEAVNVADVAFRSGFAHLGGFSTAYRGRYGVSPSQVMLPRCAPKASAARKTNPPDASG